MVPWEGYVSDETMGTFAPIVLYWVYAGGYQLILHRRPLERYRLHTQAEEEEKNLVSLPTVVRGVLLQQLVQAIVAMILFRAGIEKNKRELQVRGLDMLKRSISLQTINILAVIGSLLALALCTSETHLANMFTIVLVTSDSSTAIVQPPIVIQIFQFFVAMLVMDSWQYFVHRYMHQNKFLYRHIHSQHHRLIVPYAIGALYNHPLEGLLLDTLGGAISFLISSMTPRTAVFFFCFAVLKTVDDHCGLWLPYNIFQHLFQNNTAYHDIHHQLQGSKYNYSQPFFSIWDRILGTHMPYNLVNRKEGGFEARALRD